MTQTFVQKFFRFEGLLTALKRFPLPMLAALVFAGLMILKNHGFYTLHHHLEIPTYIACESFFVLLACALFSEKRGWHWQKTSLLSLLGVAALTAWNFSMGLPFGVPHMLMGLAVFGLCIVAPVGGADPLSETRFWTFVQKSLTGFAIATLSMGVLYIGVSVLLLAATSLFDLFTHHAPFFDAGIVIFSLGLPLYALSFIPHLTRNEPQSPSDTPETHKALIFLLSSIVAPVLLIYGLMILLYGLRLLAFQVTPVASVSWLVMGYTAAGIALYLVSYPLRDSGSFILRLFRRIFYPSLLPMLALLFWAGALRITVYGLTEMRYLLILGGVWALGLTLWTLSAPRAAKLWHGPMALVILLMCASFGPWGAEGLAIRNQTARLTQLMTQLHLTAAPVPTTQEVSWKQRQELSSLLDYFADHRSGYVPDIIAPAFARLDMAHKENRREIRYIFPDDIMKGWGLPYVSQWDKESSTEVVYTTFSIKPPKTLQDREVVTISGFDLMLGMTYLPTKCATTSPPTWLAEKLTLCQDKGHIVLSDPLHTVTIDLLPLLPLADPHKLTGGTTTLAAPLPVEGYLGARHYKFLVSELTFTQNTPITDPSNYDIWDMKGSLLIQKMP